MGYGISGRDIVLLLGGVFLLYKASHEIFVEAEARDQHRPGQAPVITATAKKAMFWSINGQIAVIDIVFSFDSVITAVGMVNQIGVMVAAVVASVGVMLVAAKPIGEFVDRHPSIKVLALAFLVMVGMALTAEAFVAQPVRGQCAQPVESLLQAAMRFLGRRRRLQHGTGHGLEVIFDALDQPGQIQNVDIVVDTSRDGSQDMKPRRVQPRRCDLLAQVRHIAIRVRSVRRGRLQDCQVDLEAVVGEQGRLDPSRQHQSVLAEGGDRLGLLHGVRSVSAEWLVQPRASV